jgi:radical SAM protein with 4Fe4S-binding SPASM domain
LFPDIADKIYNYFDIVHVSLNAFSAKTHRVVSNSDHYEQILKNLLSIAEDPAKQKKTIVRFIRQKANHFEKKDFFKFWHNKGFMAFGFDVNDRNKDVKNFNENINVPRSLGHRLKLKIFKYLGMVLLPTCPIPFLCVYIKANGDIVQCFNDWSNRHILANIKHQTISEVYNNEKYAAVRRKLIENRLDENTICSKCDLYKEGIWLTA